MSAEKPKNILIRMPANAVAPAEPELRHKRLFVSLNAAVFVFNEMRRRFSKLQKLITEYDNAQKCGVANPAARTVTFDIGYPRGNEIIALAWDLVDWMERLRKILGCVSGVKKSEPWYTSMMQALAQIEDLRHFFQHLDSNLKEFVDGAYPLMGSVLAFFPTTGGVYARVLISRPARYFADRDINIGGFKTPRSLKAGDSDITLAVGNLAVNISQIFKSLDKDRREFEIHLGEQYAFKWAGIDGLEKEV